jgi:(p)ppGpp synthase/HD superfamily hydrolase
MTPKQFATIAHKGQLRKYTGEPYIVHPARVAQIVQSVTSDPDVIAAAWLHDVVEDTTVTLEEIRKEFGDNVARIVSEVTNVATEGTRKKRKSIERRHLNQASPDAKTIKLADIIDNCGNIVAYDSKFAAGYLREKLAALYCLTKGNQHLWVLARCLLENNTYYL